MYDAAIIKQRLFAAQKTIDSGPKQAAFTLARHSPAKVTEWIAHLDGLLNDTGTLDRAKRPRGLLPTETQWVRNERILCQNDFLYAASRYFWVIDERKIPVRFTPRLAQIMNLRIWAELEHKQHAIEILQLKARQLGLSTLSELAVAHRVFFWPYTHAVTASSDPEKSMAMSKMFEFVYDELPWWLTPERTKYNAGSLMEFGAINTTLSIQHGSKITGVARGSTPNVVHLSEMSSWDDARELIDASLLPAIHPSPMTFVIFESTAKGYDDWLYPTWKHAKENHPKGRSRLYPVFLPWYVATDIKPTPTWIKQNIKDRRVDLAAWEPEVVTLKHRDRAHNYVANNPLLQSLLGKDWRLPLEQMYWWEVSRGEAADKKELNKFYEEQCSDDIESFQSEGSSVFTVEEREGFNAAIREPIATYAITGPDIDPRFSPDPRDIDPAGKIIAIPCPWSSVYKATFKLIPLIWHGYDSTDWENRLLVWELPERNEVYGLGIDPSHGLGQDRTAIEVMRKGNPYRFHSQVAEFANPNISGMQAWMLAYAIGTWYSPNRQQARMVWEVNLGEDPQLECKKRGWGNFHRWMYYDSRELSYAHSRKEGWVTNARSRPAMMARMIRAQKAGELTVRSKYMVEEMQTLQKSDDEAYINTLGGFHDDRWVALSMLYYSMTVLEIEGDSKLPQPDVRAIDSASLPTYRSYHSSDGTLSR